MVQLADTLMETLDGSRNIPSTKSILHTVCNSIAIFATVTHEVNMRRREHIRPEVHSRFRSVCSTQEPVTSKLFGDELAKKIQDQEEVNKVTTKVAQPSTSKRPYSTNTSKPIQPSYKDTAYHAKKRGNPFLYKSWVPGQQGPKRKNPAYPYQNHYQKDQKRTGPPETAKRKNNNFPRRQ